jgi:hypothetical protein
MLYNCGSFVGRLFHGRSLGFVFSEMQDCPEYRIISHDSNMMVQGESCKETCWHLDRGGSFW